VKTLGFPALAVVSLAVALAVLPRWNESAEEAGARRISEEDFRTSDKYFVCAGYGYADMGAMIDLPAYYFRRSSGELVSVCGGACMGAFSRRQQVECATLCPPFEWTAQGCEEKHHAWMQSKTR
jgi:hypothetical protein